MFPLAWQGRKPTNLLAWSSKLDEFSTSTQECTGIIR
jgi:hypothetical protein